MIANRDKRIWAIAGGSDLAVDDSNTLPFVDAKTNLPGASPFKYGDETIKAMTIGQGLKVELFASEKEFPELVKPGADGLRHQGTAVGRGLEELSPLAAEDADGRQADHPRGHQRRRQGRQEHGVRRRPQLPHRLRVLERRRAPRAAAEPRLPQGHQRRRQVRHQGNRAARVRLGRHAPRHQQLHVRRRRRALHAGRRLPSHVGRDPRGVRSRARTTAASTASSRGRGSSKPTCPSTSPIPTATSSTSGAATSSSTRPVASRTTGRRSRPRSTSRRWRPSRRRSPATCARAPSAAPSSSRAAISPKRCRATSSRSTPSASAASSTTRSAKTAPG